MSKLTELVNEIKNLIKNEGVEPEIAKLELADVNGTTVVFEAATLDDISVGVKASPDGEFQFIDGLKVKVEGGEVVEVEREIEVPEEQMEAVKEALKGEGEGGEQPSEPSEPGETSEPSEPGEPDEKDKLIEELQSKIGELTGQLEAMTSQLQEVTKSAEEKQAEIDEISVELGEIKNFYSKVNGDSSRSSIDVESQKGAKYEGFKFSRK